MRLTRSFLRLLGGAALIVNAGCLTLAPASDTDQVREPNAVSNPDPASDPNEEPLDICGPAATGQIATEFELDDGGWRVDGGPFPEPTPPVWSSEQERVTAATLGDVYWVAPQDYHGNLSRFYGGWLSFRLSGFVCGYGYRSAEAVRMRGGGHELYCEYRVLPHPTGSAYAFQLDESAEWYDAATGLRASRTQMREVLACLSDLRIRANASICDVDSALDDVLLRTAQQSPPRAGARVVGSDFEDGAQDWRIAGGSFAEPAEPLWSEVQQRVTAEANGDVYWLAPDRFRGDFVDFYGGRLRFVHTGVLCPYGHNWNESVVLAGGGESLYFNVDAPGPDGQEVVVTLASSAEWFDRATQLRATEAQLRRALSDLRELRIRANGSICDVNAALDAVFLQAP